MREYYSFTTEYGGSDELFKAVLSLDKARVEQLKANGATLTENVKQTLMNGGGSMLSNKPETRFWYLYLSDLENVGKLDFVYISRAFFEETGAPLYYSDAVHDVICKYIFNTDVFICLLECYDQKKINKKRTMRSLIQKNNVPLLEICAKHGWLKQANKRDEMIEYATGQNRPECTAWLLDFKNRTADLASERKKAEKKTERELNAAPDSALELGKLWSWKKQEDGTLIITSYKGEETEVTIPAKIGNNIVTAVGEHALSYSAPRANNKASRLMIERIIVPSGIKTIGKCALGGDSTWRRNSCLKEAVLPETLDIFTDRQAAENAPNIIAVYSNAAAVIPRMENAVFYCTKRSMNYRFEGEEEVHIPYMEVIASDALYAAIIAGDNEKYTELKKSGVVLTDYIKNFLLHEMSYGSVLYEVQREFFKFFNAKFDNREFILSSLKAETGEPLYLDRYLYSSKTTPERFDCILEYFNTKFLNKTQEMQRFINDEKTGHLAVCAKHGWLKNAATRDKMIQYAIDNNKTEATAWLLDFKNRTADLSAERKSAEKQLERKLNAPPPTDEELREKADKLFERMFTYEIVDGEIVITGYKGSAPIANEVEIPREFGGKPVVAVGKQAFYPRATGVPTRHRKNRENVTRVVLPDTVREIGEMAFLGCVNLKQIVIPSSVTRIGLRAFFTNPMTASAALIVERGSFAEEYCKKNGDSFTYKE